MCVKKKKEENISFDIKDGHYKYTVVWPDEIPDKLTLLSILGGMKIEKKLLNERAEYLALCIALMILKEAISENEKDK